MSFVLERLLSSVLGMSVGAVLGWASGRLIGVPWFGAWLGACAGLFMVSLRDAWRSQALINWLRGSQDGDAPRDGEMWGEIGYRIQRALLLRSRLLVAEQKRLAEFLSAIEVSPNGVLLLDSAEQISWCNSVAADHFGLDPIRDRGQRVTNLVRVPAFVEYLQGSPHDEAVTVSNHGRGLTLSILIRSYGEGLRMILTSDVTERLRADAMRRDFVANVSHEIRTPLTVLAGFVETMSNLPLSDSERRHVIDLMTQQTQRMQTLVADLLILAQLEGSPRPPVDQWVSLRGLLTQLESEVRALSRGRHELSFGIAGISDAAHGDSADFLLAGSQSELMSAFTNLCSNAIRYTSGGGRIGVRWLVREGGEGVFEVCDSGIGIAREHLPRLTERFYRVDGSRSRATGGTGLGLSIVKHVMQRHGGQLEIESELGLGSCFQLVFAAARVRTEPHVKRAGVSA